MLLDQLLYQQQQQPPPLPHWRSHSHRTTVAGMPCKPCRLVASLDVVKNTICSKLLAF